MSWYWRCYAQNNASNWKDVEECGAKGKKAYPSKEAAYKAAERHRCKYNIYIHVYKHTKH